MNAIGTVLGLAAVVAGMTGCTTGYRESRPFQADVDRLARVLAPHQALLDLHDKGIWKPKESLDPTRAVRSVFAADAILAALPRLSLPRGRVLDYVYSLNSMGGWPVLYSRPSGNAPFRSYAELAGSLHLPDSAATNWSTWAKGGAALVEDLRCDGTREGFFQCVVLHLMGNQFFHLWHDWNHDERIVCSPSGLDALFHVNEAPISGRAIPADVKQAAYALPLAPQIELQREASEVSVVIFTKWGGFERRTYAVARRPPYTVAEVDRRTLVKYWCGVVY
jgi:hypothetical protein